MTGARPGLERPWSARCLRRPGGAASSLMSRTTAFRFSGLGWMTCFRLNASSCCVRLAAWPPAWRSAARHSLLLRQPVSGCKHFGVTVDDGQQVVEIVRDAAGQAADALHPLCLLQLARASSDPLGSPPASPGGSAAGYATPARRSARAATCSRGGPDHEAFAPPGLDERGALLHAPSGEVGPPADQSLSEPSTNMSEIASRRMSAAAAASKVAPIPSWPRDFGTPIARSRSRGSWRRS